MNDNHLHNMKEQWQQVKLSEEARTRIRGNLLDYASFHGVRAAAEDRSITRVPFGTWLMKSSMKPLPIALLLTVMVGAGTSYAAQDAMPGDLLYGVKVGFNEKVRGALALGANAEAEFQADLFKERLAEATQLQAEGRLTGDTAAKVAANLQAQARITADAIAKSDTAVAAKTNTEVIASLESALGLVGLDTSIASDINANFATTLSIGAQSIDSFITDLKLKVNTYRALMEQHSGSLEAQVKAELTAKIDSAALLVAEANAKSEAEARASLDKAAVLLGEVEATLSTLGQVEVENGTITNIDFSIDPMQADIGGGTSGSVGGSAGGGVDLGAPDVFPSVPPSIDLNTSSNADTSVDSEVIDADSGLEATSGLGI